MPMLPWVLVVKVVCAVESPQLISICQGLAFCVASLNDPKANEVTAPSTASWLLAAVTTRAWVPTFTVPADRRLTVPYGVAIVLGSVISLAVFPV